MPPQSGNNNNHPYIQQQNSPSLESLLSWDLTTTTISSDTSASYLSSDDYDGDVDDEASKLAPTTSQSSFADYLVLSSFSWSGGSSSSGTSASTDITNVSEISLEDLEEDGEDGHNNLFNQFGCRIEFYDHDRAGGPISKSSKLTLARSASAPAMLLLLEHEDELIGAPSEEEDEEEEYNNEGEEDNALLLGDPAMFEFEEEEEEIELDSRILQVNCCCSCHWKLFTGRK